MRTSRRRRHIYKRQQQREESSDQELDENYEYSTNQQSSVNLNPDDDYDDDNALHYNNDDDDYDSYESSIISSSLSPTSSYVNIAPLPIFCGSISECPLSHLSRFRHVCRANNASSPASIFPVTLDSHAALWYDLAIDPYPTMPWPEVKSAFLNFFLRPDHPDRARSDLISLKQAESESAGFFHLRMQWILKKWPDHGLPDSLLKGVFVDGLREDYQEWIVPQRPETLEEAVRLAENWERVRGLKEARLIRRGESSTGGGGGVVAIAMSGRCGFCDGMGHEERECEVRRRMRELWLRSGRGGEGGGGELGRTVSLGRSKKYCERSASVVSDKNHITAPTAAAGDES